MPTIDFFENINFKDKYKYAYSVLTDNNSDERNFFHNLLLKTYNDEEQVNFIKMSNDYFQIAPVYSWLMFNSEEIISFFNSQGNNNIKNMKISPEVRKAIRCSMGLYFSI